jgi:hypothetical protein
MKRRGLKDATSKWLRGARSSTYRSEIFHGVDCLLAERITAHLVNREGWRAMSEASTRRGDVLLLSVIEGWLIFLG